MGRPRLQPPRQIHQESPRAEPICTKCGGSGTGPKASGFSVCLPRQLSSIATCCTQETVHLGAQYFAVEYSRCRISGVYSANGIPGYPRCCEHQCTSPSSHTYKYREPERQRQLCSFPRATLCWKSLKRENELFPSDMISSKISICRGFKPFSCPLPS